MNRKLLVILGAMATFSAFAQEAEPVGEWNFAGHIGFVNIDEATATREGIDSSALGLGAQADYLQSNWVTTIGLDIVIYDDKNEFRQTVEGTGPFNDGDISSKSSDASGVVLSVATGYQWYLGEKGDVALRAQGGIAGMFASERGIDSCENCYSEDIDVDGGLFVKASILRDTGSFAVGLYYQQFLTGDGLDNLFGITFSSGF